MKKILVSVSLGLLLLFLCGCYRQTTVILQPGETFPKATTDVSETAEISSEPANSDAVEQTEAIPSSTSAAVKPATQDEPTPSGGSNPKSEATMPAETSTPETTAAENAVTEATVPVETAAFSEATAPVETEPPATSYENPVYDISSHRIGSYEKSILEEINRHRSDGGISPLTMSGKLSALAAIRAYECSKDFSHTRPDGRSWDTVLSDYGASAYTESILYASSGTGAGLLLDACMSSGNHSEKIMNSDYRAAGIGIFDTGRYVYITIIFS